MIEWCVFGIIGLHSLVFVFLYLNFRRLSFLKNVESQYTFSILIPVRNEASNIWHLLQDISKLNHPKNKFEVIVIDDCSEDDTERIVSNFDGNFPLHYFQLTGDRKGKKPALELGVSRASNEIIITTDGDCRVQPDWLLPFDLAFTQETQLVVGPVRMNHQGWFELLQSIDFTILIGYSASLVKMGIPSMSNGANLAYRKSIFSEVNGYHGNDHLPSGDDEFLLLKVAEKYKKGVAYVNDSRAVVFTAPKSSYSEFINQRKRWLSKWTVHKKASIILSVLVSLLDNLLVLVGWTGLILGWISGWFLLFMLARVIMKIIFSYEVNKLLQSKTNPLGILLYELIYPFYALLLSFASIFGNYTWKGRKYT